MTIMAPAHRALVTAPFRGEGLDTLTELADVVLDPWIDHTPLRIYDGPRRAVRPASSAWVPWAGPCGGASRASACRCWLTTPTPTTPRSHWSACSTRPTSSHCTRR